MAAVLLPMHFTTVVPWELPWERVEPIRDAASFAARLRDLVDRQPEGEPLLTWGHHPRWHGEIDRETLNRCSDVTPIIVWHRGYHSLIANDAALDWMGIDRAEAERHPQIDLDRGAFFENGLAVANRHLRPHILDPERFRHGLDRMRQVIHAGGHTTIGDMAMGMYAFEQEWDHLVEVMEQGDTPFRIDLIPFVAAAPGGTSTRIGQILEYRQRNTHRLRFGNHVKMFADGGFFAELMMLDEPGYLDGHHGEWMTAPDQFRQIARDLWMAGLHIHVHTTGDLGVELALSTLEELERTEPREHHRFTFEHFGISTPTQIERIAAVGGLVSANVYYVHELAEVFGRHVMGRDRADAMSRLGSLEREGVPFALHSDFTMAPAQPLFNAWVAATRLGEAGSVHAPDERVQLDTAMAAITRNAALVLGREREIGTLEPGKLADVTVLDQDPWETGADGLRDITVQATVFEGQVHPVRTMG